MIVGQDRENIVGSFLASVEPSYSNKSVGVSAGGRLSECR